MIACFDTQDVVQTVRVQGLDVGGIQTETVFGDDELEVGMILAQLTAKRLAAFRSPSFLAVPSCRTIGSGINGITSRRSG